MRVVRFSGVPFEPTNNIAMAAMLSVMVSVLYADFDRLMRHPESQWIDVHAWKFDTHTFLLDR